LPSMIELPRFGLLPNGNLGGFLWEAS